MKSDRLVEMLLLLQARSPRPARELARTLNVSMRTVYRDADALSLAGVPVYCERGSSGGIALSDGYRRALSHFTMDELQALFVAASDPLADLGFGGHDVALHKIKGALPELQRRAAEKAQARIFVDHRKWYNPAQPADVLAALRRAVWDDLELEIVYRDRGGTQSRRTIAPLGLVAKAGVWYAVAAFGGELRTFRADRIAEASETGRSFERPADFDLERYWSASTNAVERIPEAPFDAELDVQAEGLDMLAPYFPVTIVADAGAVKTVRVRFPSQGVAESQIMMLSARVERIHSAELRDAVADRARMLLQVLGMAAK